MILKRIKKYFAKITTRPNVYLNKILYDYLLLKKQANEIVGNEKYSQITRLNIILCKFTSSKNNLIQKKKTKFSFLLKNEI